MNLPILTLLDPMPQCKACELHTGALNPGVPSMHLPESLPPAPTTPVVAVLGMNPGYQEDRSNKPFVGPSGRMLKEVYLKHIIPHATVILMNTARCYTPASTPPKPRHFRTCFNWARREFESISDFLHPNTPRFLLCTGAHAIGTVTKFLTAKAWSLSSAFTKQGTPTNVWGDWQLFTTFHPAAVLRDGNLMHPVSDHMTLLHSAITGSMPVASSPSLVTPFHPLKEPTP